MTEIEKALQLATETEVVIKIGDIIWAKTTDSDDEFSILTEAERVFIYISMLEAEINNGGFDQFFFNTSGEYAHEILAACEKISAFKTAKIVERAIVHFPTKVIPKNTEIRRQAMQDLDEAITKKWSELDSQFYKYEDDIAGLLIEYVKKNIELIGK